MSGLLLPDGYQVPGPRITTNRDGSPRVAGTMTRQEWNQLQAILNSQYFLFRNDGGDYGERIACHWHRSDPMSFRADLVSKPIYHMYFTYMCVERPFKGLTEGLFAIARHASDGYRSSIMQAIAAIPDLSTRHPESARLLDPDVVGETAYGILLALPERIDKDEAEHFMELINDKNPPVRLTWANL